MISRLVLGRTVCAVLLSFAPGQVSATPRAPGPGGIALEQEKQVVRALIARAEAEFAAARYSAAAEAYLDAHERLVAAGLTAKPELLFNAALAYERIDACDRAAVLFAQYLREKPEARSPDLEHRLEKAEACARDRRSAASPLPRVVTSTASGQVSRPPSEDTSLIPSTPVLVSGGVGVAALITGSILAGLSSKAVSRRDAELEKGELRARDRVVREEQDQARGLAVGAYISFGIAAAGLFTAATLYILDRSEDAPHLETGASGASMGVAW